MFSPSEIRKNDLVETMERIRSSLDLDRGFLGRRRWLDLLGMKASEYQAFQEGRAPLEGRVIEVLASHLKLESQSVLDGRVDFRALGVENGAGGRELNDRYRVAAFSRRRNAIASFDYIEESLGWRVRTDVLRRLRTNEAVLSDPMATINMRFITDATRILRKYYKLSDSHFFGMGMRTEIINRKTLIGKVISSARSVPEAYELVVEGLIKFMEMNTRYTFLSMDKMGCVVEVMSYVHVAEALNVRHLGSNEICILKAGIMASLPIYLDLPAAEVRETRCVHQGDSVCRFEFRFPAQFPSPARIKDLGRSTPRIH